MSEEWLAKHSPVAPGYYVVYEDGYSSFSPVEAFEKGYSKSHAYRGEEDIHNLAKRFTYHPPIGDQAERYELLRLDGHDLSRRIDHYCPQFPRKVVGFHEVGGVHHVGQRLHRPERGRGHGGLAPQHQIGVIFRNRLRWGALWSR